jgi:hypothetical protein
VLARCAREWDQGDCSLRAEVAFDLFGGLVIGLFLLPTADGILRRLRENGIPAFDFRGLDASIWLYQNFQFDGSSQSHGAGE